MEFQAELTHTLERVPKERSLLSELIDPTWIEQTMQAIGRPMRMGFHATSTAIIDVLRFAPMESAATLPKRLALLFEQAHLFVLPPRREDRSFPRVVKHRAAKYPRKKCQSVA